MVMLIDYACRGTSLMARQAVKSGKVSGVLRPGAARHKDIGWCGLREFGQCSCVGRVMSRVVNHQFTVGNHCQRRLDDPIDIGVRSPSR